MKCTKKFNRVRNKALHIMAQVYDPFHDDLHAREVEKTVILIYKQLPHDIQKKADLQVVRLLAVLHDTSREVIGTNFLLEPLLGGYVSGWIGYRLMIDAGFTYEAAAYVRSIIRNHESFLGLWQYPLDINGKILSDADTIEQYSLKRLQRGLRYFKQRKFSNILLNVYVLGLLLSNIFIKPTYYFKFSEVLEGKNITELKIFLNTRKKVFARVLYRRVFQLLYSRIHI